MSSSQGGEPVAVTRHSESSSAVQQDSVNGLLSIRQALEDRNMSKRATNIVMASWRSGTKKQYTTQVKKWFSYCDKRKINHFQTNLNSVLDFLSELYENGSSYSAINTAGSSLSAIGIIIDGFAIGSHPLMIRFMKGVYNLRPAKSRYVQTWYISCVLSYLRRLSPVCDLSLKMLSLKLVILLALTLASGTQSLHLLSIAPCRRRD